MEATILKPLSQYQGKKAVLFSLAEKLALVNKLKFILVGKFSNGRPSWSSIKEFFLNLKLQGSYNVSIYDQKHIFIELSKKSDFNRVWLSLEWFIAGCKMRILKWVPDFSTRIESPIVPVWIRMEGLPLYMYDVTPLWQISNAIGKPIKIDPRNLNRSMLNCARACVELDISKPLIDSFWVCFEEEDTCLVIEKFCVKVFYDALPSYCPVCFHVGHSLEQCKRKQSEGKQLKGIVTSPFGSVEARLIDEDRKSLGCSKALPAGLNKPKLIKVWTVVKSKTDATKEKGTKLNHDDSVQFTTKQQMSAETVVQIENEPVFVGNQEQNVVNVSSKARQLVGNQKHGVQDKLASGCIESGSAESKEQQQTAITTEKQTEEVDHTFIEQPIVATEQLSVPTLQAAVANLQASSVHAIVVQNNEGLSGSRTIEAMIETTKSVTDKSVNTEDMRTPTRRTDFPSPLNQISLVHDQLSQSKEHSEDTNEEWSTVVRRKNKGKATINMQVPQKAFILKPGQVVVQVHQVTQYPSTKDPVLKQTGQSCVLIAPDCKAENAKKQVATVVNRDGNAAKVMTDQAKRPASLVRSKELTVLSTTSTNSIELTAHAQQIRATPGDKQTLQCDDADLNGIVVPQVAEKHSISASKLGLDPNADSFLPLKSVHKQQDSKLKDQDISFQAGGTENSKMSSLEHMSTAQITMYTHMQSLEMENEMKSLYSESGLLFGYSKPNLAQTKAKVDILDKYLNSTCYGDENYPGLHDFDDSTQYEEVNASDLSEYDEEILPRGGSVGEYEYEKKKKKNKNSQKSTPRFYLPQPSLKIRPHNIYR